jgi:hypothetical protein
MADKTTAAAAEQYPIEDLIAQSHAVFGVKPEVVRGAIVGQTKNEFTVDELKQLITKYQRKVIK